MDKVSPTGERRALAARTLRRSEACVSASEHGCDNSSCSSRRTFLRMATQSVVAVTAFAGGMIGFAPTALADSCVSLKQSIARYQCQISCIGNCSRVETCCRVNNGPNGLICYRYVRGFPYSVKVKCSCSTTTLSGYCCLVRC